MKRPFRLVLSTLSRPHLKDRFMETDPVKTYEVQKNNYYPLTFSKINICRAVHDSSICSLLGNLTKPGFLFSLSEYGLMAR